MSGFRSMFGTFTVLLVLLCGFQSDLVEAIPAQRDPDAVRQLDTSNFDEIALDTTKDVMVMFYAPWCGHCKALAPVYEDLAIYLKDLGRTDIVIARVDATKNAGIAEKYEVNGFPTLRLFAVDDKSGETEFSGHRTRQAMISFIENRGNDRRIPGSKLYPLNFQRWAPTVMNSSQTVLVEMYFPWNRRDEAVLEELADYFFANPDPYLGPVVIAKMDTSVHKLRNLAATFGITKFPQTVLFTKTDKTGKIIYDGPRVLSAVVDFIKDKVVGKDKQLKAKQN